MKETKKDKLKLYYETLKNSLDLNKNEDFKGYKFDKRVFRVGVILVVLVTFLGMAFMGFSLEKQVYLSCPADGDNCLNPLFGTCEEAYCMTEYILPGFEWGVPPNWFVVNQTWLVIVIVISCFVANHFLFNRGYKFYRWAEDYEADKVKESEEAEK